VNRVGHAFAARLSPQGVNAPGRESMLPSRIASARQQFRQHKDSKDFKLKTRFTEDEVFSMLSCIQTDVQPGTR
jgi:hypothetical protein